MAVVSEVVADLGITAIPTPIFEVDYSWMTYQTIFHRFLLKTAVGFETSAASKYVIDSKAMRKVGISEQLVDVYENQVAVGGQIVTQGRQLIQLH